MPIASVNPATTETLRTFEPLSPRELDQKLAIADSAFREHRRTSFLERAARMLKAAELLERDQNRHARTITLEMGKPIQAAADEVAKCARACRYYAGTAGRALADEPVETGAQQSFIRYQPLGPVLAVMPWNFPFWQVFRFAAPALMAGNAGLLKHASNVPQCALAIEDIFRDAGFAEGVFQTLLIGSDQVTGVLEDPRIAAATLTGSEPAGASVASVAGRNIKKTVLELGGSDPFIVMPSADLDEAARIAVKARIVNNGQSCIAAKRFIVAEAVYDEFTHRFIEGMRALKLGDPLDPATELGPLATPQIAAEVAGQVEKLIAAGAKLLTGGERDGNFYHATILANVPTDSPVYREEVFGPVAQLFRVQDIDHAIALANDTPFGLAASAWTNDSAEQARFIDEIESGQVFLNAMVASDPRLPFGGIKRSGYGRELSYHGIREFTNIKTIWIQ